MRGADDLVLPVDRDGKPPHPLLPVIAGAVAEFAAGRLELALERLIRAEHHVHRPRQNERRFVLDIGERRVSRQPHRHVIAPVADVIAA